MFFTNNAINFFLYVISGRKFRNEVLQLFKCQDNGDVISNKISEFSTKLSKVSTDEGTFDNRV